MVDSEAYPGEKQGDGDPQTVRITIDTQSVRSEDDTVVIDYESDGLASRYETLDKIGQGGMGNVYLARDCHLGRYVAIKRLNALSRESPSMKERFFHEGRAVSLLNHIHIVHIYTLGEDSEGPYIVMEYIAGPKPAEGGEGPAPAYTLSARVNREGPMPLDAALELMVKLCRAVEYAHARSVVHRDLKPTNVLLDESGEPKIVDFGLARVRSKDIRPLTLPGEKMLSLGYGAPEQEVDASLTDERADVYGLGALLYFCITGKNPRYFRQNDLPEVLRMPVIKALETDRNQRWESVKAFRTALTLIKSPSATKLTTSKTTWHCKWCDTVNPVVIRFCGKCGWDGGMLCPECGSESRFGIQFCGVCGADAKAYENVQMILNDMQKNMQQKEFGLVSQDQSRIAGFRPQGVNGRALIDRVHHVAARAATSLRRRGTLRDEIKMEFKEHNYEQVRRLIREYNELVFDNEFDDMDSKLDDLQCARDLERLRVSVRAKHWDYAMRLVEDLRVRTKGNLPEVERLFDRINLHCKLRKGVRIGGLVLIGFVLYMFSAAPVYRIWGRPERGLFHLVYAPLSWVQKSTVFHRPLTAYAGAYDAGEMFSE